MKYVFLLTAILAFTFITCSSGGEKVTANVSSVNITPPLEMKFALGGYGERMNKPAEAIHDSIYAKALVLKKGIQKYAVITIDILGLPPNVKNDLVQRVSESGWSMENMMLLPSHSHGSLEMMALNSNNAMNIPQIGVFHPELLEFFLEKLERLIRQADRNCRPVKIGTESSILDGLNRNRRRDPEVDRELTVTRIDLTNGNPLAVLVNWTAHPTFIDGVDMLASAEWPGYLQQELEKQIGSGVMAMYYNGAEGDQSPVLDEPVGRYERIRIYGEKIAYRALEIYNQIDTKKINVFNYSYRVIRLPEMAAHPTFMKTGGSEYGLSEQTVGHVLKMLCPEETGLGALRIGDLIISAVPGEMTAALGLKIKKSLKESGVKHPVIGGLSSEWISYILSRDQYINGEGYESSMSFYGPDLGELITSEIINTALLLTDLR